MYRKRAVIYARQSNGKEEESESISMQIKLCREHAIKHNIEVIGEYSDANCSGRLYPSGAEQLMEMDAAFNNWYGSNSLKKKSRPGLRCVLETLQYIDYIIVYDITRLYRPVQSSYLQGYIDTLLVDNRVIVMTVREGENNPSDFSDSLVTTIKSHVNDNQIKLTSEKSKLALRKLRDSGYLVNGAGMYGIRYVGGKERRIEIIPERAEVIRYIFENILRQKPYNRILREINTLFHGRCDGKAFYMTSLRHIASQPFYCGFMYDSDGTLIPAKQMAGKAIVSLEEWRKANAIMQQGKRQAHEGNRTRLPFSGLLKCGYCGAKMIAGLDGEKVYYRCITAVNTGNMECRQSRITINLVRNSSCYTGLKHAISPLLLLGLYKYMKIISESGTKEKELNEMRLRLGRLKNRLEKIGGEYVAERIDAAAYDLALSKANSAIRKLKEKIQLMENALENEKSGSKIALELMDKPELIMNDNLPEHIFTELVREVVKEIRCFHDCICISTVYGDFHLKRYMEGIFRNFPRFRYEWNVDEIPSDTAFPQVKVIYEYGRHAGMKLLFSHELLQIYEE